MATQLTTYYDVLQVERDATPEGVRRAYRKLAQKYHPDKMPGNANAPRAMAAINAAYEVLSDPHQRAEHDRWIEVSSRPARLTRTPPPEPESFWAFVNPVTGWPWYLLFVTMAFALTTIGVAVYFTALPARAATPPKQQHVVMQPQAQAPMDAQASLVVGTSSR